MRYTCLQCSKGEGREREDRLEPHQFPSQSQFRAPSGIEFQYADDHNEPRRSWSIDLAGRVTFHPVSSAWLSQRLVKSLGEREP